MTKATSLLLVVLLTLLGCAQSKIHQAENFVPLGLGNVWVYKVIIDGKPVDGYMQLLVSDVNEADTDAPSYVVSIRDDSIPAEHRADEPQFYNVLPGDGIYCEICEAFLLKSPLRKGESWPAGGGHKDSVSRVIEVNAIVKVGDRNYPGSVIVERTEPALDRRIVFDYAPSVGMVSSHFYKLSTGAKASAYREELLLEHGRLSPPRYLMP